MPTNDRVSVTLTPELREQLRRRALANGLSESATARQLIKHALAQEAPAPPQDEREIEGEA